MKYLFLLFNNILERLDAPLIDVNRGEDDDDDANDDDDDNFKKEKTGSFRTQKASDPT